MSRDEKGARPPSFSHNVCKLTQIKFTCTCMCHARCTLLTDQQQSFTTRFQILDEWRTNKTRIYMWCKEFFLSFSMLMFTVKFRTHHLPSVHREWTYVNCITTFSNCPTSFFFIKFKFFYSSSGTQKLMQYFLNVFCANCLIYLFFSGKNIRKE